MKKILFAGISLLPLLWGCGDSVEVKQTWYDDAKQHIKEEYQYIAKNGTEIKKGYYKKFYDSGELMQEAAYTQGELTDTAKAYYKSGKLYELATFVKGK